MQEYAGDESRTAQKLSQGLTHATPFHGLCTALTSPIRKEKEKRLNTNHSGCMNVFLMLPQCGKT
jgi:hypothetical protein